jgi:ABC-type Fe3+ transport system substrate-binding protein
MINLMIQTPVNTRARITNYIRDLAPEMAKELNDEIIITSPHDFERSGDCKDNWIDNCIKDNILPDMVLTHASEFSVLYGKDMKRFFSTMGGDYTTTKPVRKEVEAFVDKNSIFYPLFIVPIVICYNTEGIDESELNNCWEDLLNPKFKAVLPDRSKPVTKIVGAHILKTCPENFGQFDNLDYIFSPREVIKSLISKEHDLAITNTAFAKLATGRGVSINPTKEGVLLLPQVVVFKKDADKRLLRIIDHLLEDEIQNYLGENGFFPANSNAVAGETITLNGMIDRFEGWGSYIKDIREYELSIGGESND